MNHLCSELGINTVDLQRKIWTVFEYSIRFTDLMKNRHLDQLLMCAVYVICKVTGRNYQFIDIMKQYREQPQANSEIYRNVLIKGSLFLYIVSLISLTVYFLLQMVLEQI